MPLITWLTLTGIQFPNGPWVSDTDRNFTLKLARGKKSFASHKPAALGRQAFLPVGLFCGGEEISMPETRPIRKSYIFDQNRQFESMHRE